MDRSKLTIGPMVAHTTSSSSRIWLRAGEDMRKVGCTVVARLFDRDMGELLEEKNFKFHSAFDYIGLIEFGKENSLEPDSVYKYQVGLINNSGTFELYLKSNFKTFSEDTDKEISFVTGSCRHLYVKKFFRSSEGSAVWDKRHGVEYGDMAFKSISESGNPDLIIMTGDQVYCDHEEGSFSPFNPAKKLHEYLDNYHRAYAQPFFSSLASKIPLYMTMDDHEIKNDWQMDMISSEYNPDHENYLVHYRNGLKSYSIYQAALSPVINDSVSLESELASLCDTSYEEKISAHDIPYIDRSKNLYYEFSHGPARFFGLDTRLERYMQRDSAQMLGKHQFGALKTWLKKYQNDKYVKIIITAVPLFPDTKNFLFWPVGAPEDKWGGYSEQRLQLLEFIRKNNMRKVVFVSGDVHVSLAAKLLYEGKDIGVYSIISSGFTWPLPGLQRFNFDWRPLPVKSQMVKGKRMPDTENRSKYQAINLTKWPWLKTGYREHNYCKVKTDGTWLKVIYYKARSGKIIGKPLNIEL